MLDNYCFKNKQNIPISQNKFDVFMIYFLLKISF